MPRILTAIVLGGIIASAGLLLAEGKDTEIDDKKIYFGDPDNFKQAGVLKLLTVFNAIPEYREATKRGKDDPQYYILLEKANQKFLAALQRVADEHKYDLIGEVGAIKIKGKTVPDVTDLVVKALPE